MCVCKSFFFFFWWVHVDTQCRRMRVFDATPFQVGSLIGHDIPCAAPAVSVNTRTQCVVTLTESLSCKQPAFNMRSGFVGTSVSALCSRAENVVYHRRRRACYFGCNILFSGP